MEKKKSKKEELTPVQIATKAFEEYYVQDDELQRRVDGFIISRECSKKILTELGCELDKSKDSLDALQRLLVRKARKGKDISSVDKVYLETIDDHNNLIERYTHAKAEYEKSDEYVKSYKNTSDHRKMVAWTIISSLDQELKKAGYPNWAKKYEGKII